MLLSGLAAYRVHDQELALDGIATAGGHVRPSAMSTSITPRSPVAAIAGMFRSIIAYRR